MEKSFRDVLDMDRDGVLVLPDFQREFIWDTEQQKKLIATFLVQIPINGMLLLSGKEGDFAGKQMCWRENHLRTAQKDELSYLLDGQQRLSTLKNAFSDIVEDADDWVNNLYYRLKNRWFLRLMPENEEEDIFGLRVLKFPYGSASPAKLEPAAMELRLKFCPLYKKDATEWYGVDAKKSEFQRCAVENRMLPLYKLYSDNTQVTSILNRIAQNRMMEIPSEWEEMPPAIQKQILENLCEINEDARKWESETPSIGDPLWNECASTLSTGWAIQMGNYLEEVMKQELTFIMLKKDEIGRAIVIFENLNNSGTALSLYDLVVARAAKCKKYSPLTKQIDDIIRRHSGDSGKDGKFSALKMGIIDAKTSHMTSRFQTWYLDMLALLIKKPESEMPDIGENNISAQAGRINQLFKRTNILSLDSEAIHEKSELAIRSLLRAVTFLNQRCGIYKINQIGYKLMVLPIAYLMQDEDVLKDKKKLNRMEYWYWVSLFSGRYITNQNHRCAEDVAWLYQFAGRKADYNPFERDAGDVLKQNKYSDLETLLQPNGANGAISDGICAYVLSKRPHDFIQDKTVELSAVRIANNEKISDGEDEMFPATLLTLDLHHIIPLGTSKTMGDVTKDLRNDDTNILNSPLNLTYISSSANRFIGAQSPQAYLEQLYKGSITDHFIPELPKDLKKEENQKKFLEDRYQLIVDDLHHHLQELRG